MKSHCSRVATARWTLTLWALLACISTSALGSLCPGPVAEGHSYTMMCHGLTSSLRGSLLTWQFLDHMGQSTDVASCHITGSCYSLSQNYQVSISFSGNAYTSHMTIIRINLSLRHHKIQCIDITGAKIALCQIDMYKEPDFALCGTKPTSPQNVRIFCLVKNIHPKIKCISHQGDVGILETTIICGTDDDMQYDCTCFSDVSPESFKFHKYQIQMSYNLAGMSVPILIWIFESRISGPPVVLTPSPDQNICTDRNPILFLACTFHDISSNLQITAFAGTSLLDTDRHKNRLAIDSSPHLTFIYYHTNSNVSDDINVTCQVEQKEGNGKSTILRDSYILPPEPDLPIPQFKHNNDKLSHIYKISKGAHIELICQFPNEDQHRVESLSMHCWDQNHTQLMVDIKQSSPKISFFVFGTPAFYLGSCVCTAHGLCGNHSRSTLTFEEECTEHCNSSFGMESLDKNDTKHSNLVSLKTHFIYTGIGIFAMLPIVAAIVTTFLLLRRHSRNAHTSISSGQNVDYHTYETVSSEVTSFMRDTHNINNISHTNVSELEGNFISASSQNTPNAVLSCPGTSSSYSDNILPPVWTMAEISMAPTQSSTQLPGSPPVTGIPTPVSDYITPCEN